MNRLAFSALFFLLSLSAVAQKKQSFEIKHLTGDFYIYTTWGITGGQPFPANGMYIVTAQGIVMIDSPWDTAQAVPLVTEIEKRHQKKVIAAIATHFHEDRTGSFDIFRRLGIKTYSTCQTLQLCKEKHEPQAQYCFTSDTTFDFADHKVATFYPGVGHSPDNIVVWITKERILYGGCLIKSTEAATIGNLSDADIELWDKTLIRVEKVFPDIRYMIPGHQRWNSRAKKVFQHDHDLIAKARYKAIIEMH